MILDIFSLEGYALIGVWTGGGGGGLQPPPPKFGQLIFFGLQGKFGQSQFLRSLHVCVCVCVCVCVVFFSPREIFSVLN